MVAVIRKADPLNDRIGRESLRIDPVFLQFIEDELLPAAAIESRAFWAGVDAIIADLTPVNRRLLAERVDLQQKIDRWHREHRDVPWDAEEYAAFLRRIGYLVDPGGPFRISTRDVDPEIATIAGPQLVVPVNNARFAINAANARWGSLFDALYGTDAIAAEAGRRPARPGYDPVRGAAVIREALAFLDRVAPLQDATHADVVRYSVAIPTRYARLSAVLRDGRTVGLVNPRQFAGWHGYDSRRSILLANHGLHIEIQVDPDHPVGRDAPGHIRDILLESALTTIQDCEDSVAAVDAGDKVQVYRNWLGLMQGTLEATFEKNGRTVTRRLNRARKYIGIDGRRLVLPGTSLMMIRNVGHLMTTDAILDADGEEVFEGILDGIVTTACALANSRQKNQLLNSGTGSIYIVKPKMHGPREAGFADTLFARVEDLLALPRNTIKVGVMDEERRTTVNLGESIRALRERIVFINTGFLDRTGDEIRTSMYAGPVLPKEDIKRQRWLAAYEDRNVDVGIACGLPGRAQIGKGMWPMPDEMGRMMATKQAHPEAGASCAWVPSPTAATLHAMHYHAVDVAKRQAALAAREMAPLDAILTPPICDKSSLHADRIRSELDNNAQGILGYVVRWIDQGIGCSKVPDIRNIGLMEDRATLRISSQHMANWLLHGVCTEDEVRDTLRRMARVVDDQNADDPHYRRMSDDYDSSVAFQAACALVFEALSQPNGYTEPLLQQFRRRRRALAEE